MVVGEIYLIAFRWWWLTMYVRQIRDRRWSQGTIFHSPFILPLADLVLMWWSGGLVFLFVFSITCLSNGRTSLQFTRIYHPGDKVKFSLLLIMFTQTCDFLMMCCSLTEISWE
jgi:hypothetical protein